MQTNQENHEPVRWYLFDYGMVISTAPEDADWQALEESAGMALRDSSSGYWQHRLAYDEGRLTAVDYWSRVLGRPASVGLASQLDALDAVQWSHYNLDTLDALEMLSNRGSRLAVLSNMPASMADQFSTADWTRYFDKLFFSSRLGLIKPDPRIFKRVLAELDARPEQVIFVDDKPENVLAARQLGIDARLHEPGIDLITELAP